MAEMEVEPALAGVGRELTRKDSSSLGEKLADLAIFHRSRTRGSSNSEGGKSGQR